MTVRSKLLTAFGSLVAVVFLVSWLSLRALGGQHQDFADYAGQTVLDGQQAASLRDAAGARAIAARNLVLVTSDEDRQKEKDAVQSAHASVGHWLSKLKTTASLPGTGDEQRRLLATIEDIESRYGPLALQIVGLAVAGQREQAITKMSQECRPLLAALTQATNAYVELSRQRGVQVVRETDQAYEQSRLTLLAACALAVVLALVLALLITRNINCSLGAEPAALGAIAQRVAGGDLSPVAGGEQAVPGSVLASLAHMQNGLARVVHQVRQASDSIATGSSEIAAGNADLSRRTEQQSSSLQEAAASMEQMTATVSSNAESVRQATELAHSARAVAARGGAVVQEVVSTMEGISGSSRKIADIIGVIDGIAFQTNILALNAAVEAARAGEQGRGFAVVAGEVRNLAQRSASAAREIKALIGGSGEQVEAGARLVDSAGATMSDIVQQVRRVADLVSEIGSATAEQSAGIGGVNNAVSQLDQVTQQNVALVEQSAAAAESLRQQALSLAGVVSLFRLGPDTSAPNPVA